ncbi:c-type cytochrome [Blattabacterium cuenoti]|uniref:c-type cytochrome n=1 Tax=Blattabacterium cuenoti TaxID=1653831 RepID=UPI00163BF6C8|nr:cytochrome c [Blattabacterium cuenoti]
MKISYRIIISIILLKMMFLLESCWFDKEKTNTVYMPDMYYSDAYEPYSDPYFYYNKKIKKIKIPFFINGKTSSLLPVKGTINRNNSYDPISDEIENKGFDHSKKVIKYFIYKNKEKKEEYLKKGKKLYNINCSICHGNNGDGQGQLVKNEKILGIPDYKDRDLTIGSVYYVITYGKNNMNSYSSQLNKIDRWKIAEYVMYLKNNKR